MYISQKCRFSTNRMVLSDWFLYIVSIIQDNAHLLLSIPCAALYTVVSVNHPKTFRQLVFVESANLWGILTCEQLKETVKTALILSGWTGILMIILVGVVTKGNTSTTSKKRYTLGCYKRIHTGSNQRCVLNNQHRIKHEKLRSNNWYDMEPANKG